MFKDLCLFFSICTTCLTAVTLLLFLCCATRVAAESSSPFPAAKSSTDQVLLNGGIIAEEISRATGIAISPILGVSVLGAYTYYSTPPAKRHQVPWHARPAFWVPLLIVLLCILLKDSSKIALPKIIVMPLDAIETLLEKNASAAVGLLVILSSLTGRGLEHLRLAGPSQDLLFVPAAHAAENINHAASSGFLELAILYLLVTVVFAIVWVVSQSFNFLILLCPFSWLDLLLAGFKNSIVALLLGAYLVNPFLGLFFASLIIVICFFLFARSYRFVIFGTIFASDILLKKSRKNTMESKTIRAFAGSAAAAAPSLSYGYLTEKDARLVFHYKPWLFLSRRSAAISFPVDHCEVGTGRIAPVIIASKKNTKKYMTLFRLRPLYHSHEDRVAEILGIKGVRDVAFGKSLRDGLAWLGEQLGMPAKTKHEVG